jgi:outer membrane protein assembly factor BamB
MVSRFRVMLVVLIVLAAWAPGALAENWPGFRGPRGDGTSLEKGLPLRWSATENIAWKVRVPGRGHASPVVWEDRLFLVSALEAQQERVLLCLDRRTGKTLWQRTVLKAPLEPIHTLNSYASSTPLTDGQRVYVSFLDRERMFIAAYDFQGNRVWAVHPGPFSSKHGYSSSPILYKDRVIVNGDHDGDGFLIGLNSRTGERVWKIARPNNTRSYCTPLIREVKGRPQMMLSGSKCVASYSPEDGSLQWILDGPTEQFVAAPVYNGRLLFITAGYPDRHILAIRPDGKGNVTNSHIAWRTRRGCSYVPSPIVMGEFLLVVSDGGFLTCFVADTGEILWTERLGGGHSASPVSSEDRVYFQSDRGVTTVVRPGRTFEKLAVNEIGEETYASPVVSQGQLFLRGVEHLFAIGKQEGVATELTMSLGDTRTE